MWVKKAQNGWNFLPGSIQPFPVLPACGSRCGSMDISRGFFRQSKNPQTAVLRGFCGAAIQIRTGDLILTNTLRYVQTVLSGTIWAFFVPVGVVYSTILPTVSTQLFRVWVRVWVRCQNSKQKPREKGSKAVLKICAAKQRRQLAFVSVKPIAEDASYGAQSKASISSRLQSVGPRTPVATPTENPSSRRLPPGSA